MKVIVVMIYSERSD